MGFSSLFFLAVGSCILSRMPFMCLYVLLITCPKFQQSGRVGLSFMGSWESVGISDNIKTLGLLQKL